MSRSRHRPGQITWDRKSKHPWIQEYETRETVDTEARYYANYLAFFTDEITQHGTGDVLERYLFSRDANDNGALVLLRFIGGA